MSPSFLRPNQGRFLLAWFLLACSDAAPPPQGIGTSGTGGSDLHSKGGASNTGGSGPVGAGGASGAGGGSIAGQAGVVGTGGHPSGQGGSSGTEGGGAAGSAGQSLITTFRVHYPTKPGQTITIRGDAGGLSWSTGLPMELAGSNLWIFSTHMVLHDVEWKPMLNDTTWARGPNYLAQAGSTVDVYPHFQVTSGVVGIYKEKFSSKYLAEKRDIWAYLPPTYLENTEARFPVLYMHDGQNLFDKALAFGGNEWKVDEAMDTAAESGEAREAVVIGVGNTSARIYEYTPTPDPEYTPSGGGDNYLMLLMEELKPLVDAELRTLPDPSNTALIGSSLGGLISSYGGVHHPEVFGLIGALSPSVWWDGKMLLGQVASIQGKELRALRVYVDSGDAGPSQDGLANTKLLADQYREVGYQDGVNFLYIVQAGATHSEVFWAQRFPTAAAFLLGPRPNSGSQPF